MTKIPQYKHDSLALHHLQETQRTHNQIRLLRVWPNDGEHIKCSLEIHRIDERPYKALSYTWGPRTPLNEILIDGFPFQIRENLWWFLHYVSHGQLPYRSEDKERWGSESVWLWIDQICIDQSNGPERNYQVSLMSQIYRSASGVIAWLGKEGEDTIIYMKALERAAMKLRRVGGKFRSKDDQWNLPRVALSEMLKMRYWTRLWVVQEFVLAAAVKVVWGCRMLDWEDLRLLANKLRQDQPEKNHAEILIGTRSRRRDRKQPLRTFRFMEICLDFMNFRCAEPHDRVYALMGMYDDPSLQITVDYSKPAGEVFWEATEYHSAYGEEDRLIQLGKRMGVTGDEEGIPPREVSYRYPFSRDSRDPKEIFAQPHQEVVIKKPKVRQKEKRKERALRRLLDECERLHGRKPQKDNSRYSRDSTVRFEDLEE